MDLDSLGSCDSGPTVANGFDSVESLLVSLDYFKIIKKLLIFNQILN